MPGVAHVLPEEKPVVLHELRRITNPEGRLVVSLPIETGQARFARRVLRRLSGKHPCEYSYDFRQDVKLLETNFKLASTEFWPSRLLPLTVILDCRI